MYAIREYVTNTYICPSLINNMIQKNVLSYNNNGIQKLY